MIRILLLIALLSCAAPSQALEVTFRPDAEVDTVAVTLADIADFSEESEMARALASRGVGQSGQPGQDVILDSEAIIRQLHKNRDLTADIVWSGAASVKVHRRGVTVGPEKLQQILDGYLADHRDDLPAADIRFIVDDSPLPFVLPTGDLKWEVVPSDPGILGSSRFSIIFTVDGKVRRNMSLTGRFEAMAPVAVAAADLAKGSLLSSQQIVMETRDITRFRKPCLDPAQLEGRLTLRSIKAGSVVELSMVQVPPLIKKGEVVKIVLNQPGISLSTLGIARNDGGKDELIKVENISSNKILQCRVTAAGLVEVAL